MNLIGPNKADSIFMFFPFFFECLRLKYKGFNREKCVKMFLD